MTKECKLKLYYFPRYCFPDTRIGQPVAAGTKCIWQCPGQSSYHQVKHIPTIQQPVQVKSLTNKHSIGVVLASLRKIRSSEPKSPDSQFFPAKKNIPLDLVVTNIHQSPCHHDDQKASPPRHQLTLLITKP